MDNDAKIDLENILEPQLDDGDTYVNMKILSFDANCLTKLI